MTPARSRYSSSGIATRRVVPSACLAWAVVFGGLYAARALAGVMLGDAAKIHEEDAAYLNRHREQGE